MTWAAEKLRGNAAAPILTPPKNTTGIRSRISWGNQVKSRQHRVSIFACALVLAGVYAPPAVSQTAEVKEKPPMYTYVSNWVLPRARWADLEKGSAATNKVMEQAMDGGTLVGYGRDETLVHTADGATQDAWWSSMSMAGLMNVLDEIYKSGNATTSVLGAATKHWDGIYVSRYYNWHPGAKRGAFTHIASYKLKADAPDDAVDVMSKNFIVPLMEKLLADGTLLEYEIDEETIHTEAPGTFWLDFICVNADGLDKVNAALGATFKANAFAGPALFSMVDFSAHRDELMRTNAAYK